MGDRAGGRILAIDYGTRRLGLAISDPYRVIARGAGTIDNAPDLLDRLADLAGNEGVIRIVVGMPYAPDGGPGAKGREVEAFVERLIQRLGIPVDTWDESHSSREARRVLKEGGMRRRKRERTTVDEMAARLILQEFLDHESRSPGVR